VRAGVPVFGICRGFQEMNVAFGGTLHQKLHEVPGYLDHRDDGTQPLEVQYGPAHEVTLEPGGVLRSLAVSERIQVNSLHNQGIDRLGAELAVEARAPDGVDRGVPLYATRSALRWRCSAPRVEGDEQSVFARTVCRLRAGQRERASVKERP